MKSLGRTLLAVAASAALAAPLLAEDVVVVYKTTGSGGDGTSTQYFSSDRMRSKDKDSDTIFEYSSGTITNIDHKKKEWSQITLAEIEKAMEAASAQMEQMRAQMEAMPAAMRERMEKMMGGVAGDVTVTEGGTREVAGYATREHTVAMGETMTMHLWNTTDLELPISPEKLRKMTAFTGPMAAMAANPMFKGFGQLAEKMSEIEGVTLASTTSTKFMGRGSESSREATEVRTGAIPASEFDVAAIAPGYKKVDSPLKQLGKR